MSELCRWLHEQLEPLPTIRYPFELGQLPRNGIYFLYEDGETWGHGKPKPRVIRIGTHKDGNFQDRIGQHYLLDETKMNFDVMQAAPKDRSIFRKHIGRALLAPDNDPYLLLWEVDFTKRENREKYKYQRSISKEKEVEVKITRIIREHFNFKFIVLEGQAQRMGTQGLEGGLIGTLAQCGQCRPSEQWLGQNSSKRRIRESGLWLIQHLKHPPLSDTEQTSLASAIRTTRQWISNNGTWNINEIRQ